MSQGKYDIQVASGDVSIGFMLDRAVPDNSVDFAEPEPDSASGSVVNASTAGAYSWRDQRNIPGVSISDFRGGQGQKVLDRGDSAANAFNTGRHLNCEVEGEVSLAQSFIGVQVPGITNVICEAGGKIWAAFDPDDTVGEELDPKSVRYLFRKETTLSAALDDSSGTVSLTSATDVAIGDYLYLPLAREVLLVTGIGPVAVDRAACLFDNQDAMSIPRAHEAGDIVCVYGWRAVSFTPVGATPNEYIPTQHVQSFAYDGEYLYAAFSDTHSGGYNSTIWRYEVRGTNPTMTLYINDVAGVQQLCYGLGWLYYAADDVAGYVRKDVAGTGVELAQLSLNAVIGEEWNGTNQVYDPVSRELMTPSITSVGLEMNGTWCYWLTQSGRDSWLYRIQAPLGFMLVHQFSKGFVATCLMSAFGNVYVGGYKTKLNGRGLGEDSHEGMVYLIKDDNVERVVTLDELEDGLDNRIKGLTAVGDVIAISTNTSVYHYSVRSAGWWHVGTLPPRDYDTNITTVELTDWTWDTVFEMTSLPQNTPATWDKTAQSSKAPTWQILSDADSSPYLNVNGNNCLFARWKYVPTLTGDDVLMAIKLPRTSGGCLRRRAVEVYLSNGTNGARFRVRGVQKNDIWKFGMQIGRWHPNRADPVWSFEEVGWYDSREPYTIWFQLSARGSFIWATAEDSSVRLEGPPSVPASKLKKDTTHSAWFSGGIPLGNAIVYNSKTKKWIADTSANITKSENFRFAASSVSITAGDLSPRRYVVNPPEATGAAAELDGELFIPLGDDGSYDGQLCFSRVGEVYTGDNALLITSDSYQNMGTALKFYRRFEVNLPQLLDGQSLIGQAYINDQPQQAGDAEPDVLEVVGDGIEGSQSRGSTLLQKVINQGGTKSRVKLRLFDTHHLRDDGDKLKVNSIGTRFMPASSPMKLQYVFDCIDYVECRDDTRWDVTADEAVDFIKRLKKAGSMCTVTTDDGVWSCLVDAYKFVASTKDEEAISVKQGSLQVVFQVIDE